MNVEVIKEGENIFPKVFEELLAEGLDFSKNLVVFPGKRPSFFLVDEIKRRINKSFIPPIVFSIDEFIDFCYEQELKINNRKIDTLSGIKLLRDLLKKNKFYDKYADNLNLFLPLGLKLISALEELKIELIPKEKVKSTDYMLDASITSENLSRLSDVYEDFYNLLESKNFSSRSLRYFKVANSEIKLNGFERIIFAGFFALSESERKLFKKLSEDDRVKFIFQGEYAKDYAFDRVYKPSVLNVENIDIYECPDTHSQVFKLNKLLETELTEKKDKETFLIISPTSETLIPLINSIALEMNDYNISLGYPIVRTPLYSFIEHLFDVLISKDEGKIYIPDYLKFVLHPYTKNIQYKKQAEITRIIFHKIEETLLKERFITYRPLSDLEDIEFLKEIWQTVKEDITLEELKSIIKQIHDQTIRSFENISNIKDFAVKLKSLVNFIYENSTARWHILFFPYCEAMLSALTELETSLFAEEYFHNTFEYFDFFKKFISLYKVPFHGTPIKDIQVLGFLESRNLKFDNVYILDVNEGVIPDSEREDSILPFDVRRYLGLPTYIERDNLFDYYLRTIIAGAKKTAIFYVENDNKEKSRFVEKIIWEKQKREKSIENKPFKTISYKFTLKPYKPKEVAKTPEIIDFLKNMSYSASSLDTYFLCPLKFYYQKVLLPKEEEGYEDFENKDVGTLVHEILKDYYDDRKIDYDETKFNKILDKNFEKTFGKDIKGQVLIIKYQVKKRLSEFIKSYKDIAGTDSITIIDLEKEIKTKVAINGIGEININGRIDRIEKRGEELFILDYKTSSNENKYKVRWNKFDIEKRDEWQKAFKTVQLFFYMFLMKASDYVEKVDNAGIILLGKKSVKDCEIKLFNNSEEKEKLYSIDVIITRLIVEIIKENSFKPTENLGDCKNCIYINFCYK